MVNNEFHIIGTALTNFESISNDNYSSYLLRVEVEKMGSKIGNNFELVVQIYAANRAVDTNANVLGNLVAVNGYLDTFTTEKGSLLIKAIAQNVIVLNKRNFDNVAVAKNIEVD